MSENLAKPKGLRRGSCGRRAFEARLRGGTPAPRRRISASAEWAPPIASRSTASETRPKPNSCRSSPTRRRISAPAEWAPPIAGHKPASETGSKPNSCRSSPTRRRISASAEWAPPLAGRSTASETGSKPIAGSSSVPRRCIPRTFTPFFAATPPLSSDCGRLRAPHQSNLRCLTVRPSWMMSFSEAMPKATCCSAKFLVTILSLSMVLMPSSVIGLSLTRSSAPVGM